MNKNILVIGAIVFAAVIGGLFIANQQSQQTEMASDKKDAMQKDEVKMTKDDKMQKEDSMMQKEDSRYFEYSKESFDNSSDKKRVLFFYASWCPICRPADENFKQNLSKIPEDAVLIRVNFNDPETEQAEKDLAKKYKITYQHTFVQIDKDGNEITRWNSGQIEELLGNIK